MYVGHYITLHILIHLILQSPVREILLSTIQMRKPEHKAIKLLCVTNLIKIAQLINGGVEFKLKQQISAYVFLTVTQSFQWPCNVFSLCDLGTVI